MIFRDTQKSKELISGNPVLQIFVDSKRSSNDGLVFANGEEIPLPSVLIFTINLHHPFMVSLVLWVAGLAMLCQ